MDLNEKNKYKIEFKKALDTFTEKLEEYVSTEKRRLVCKRIYWRL